MVLKHDSETIVDVGCIEKRCPAMFGRVCNRVCSAAVFVLFETGYTLSSMARHVILAEHFRHKHLEPIVKPTGEEGTRRTPTRSGFRPPVFGGVRHDRFVV